MSSTINVLQNYDKNLPARQTFIGCKNLQKELIIHLYIQILYLLGCNWTDNGCIFIHQVANVLINSIDIVINVSHLKTICNVQIPPTI